MGGVRGHTREPDYREALTVVGQKRGFEHASSTSALAPIATVLLQHSNRRSGPQPDVSNHSKRSLYSMTSLASARSFGGILSPIAFAAFRLTTSSILVGCNTGKSADLEPLRILAAYAPACRHASAKFAP